MENVSTNSKKLFADRSRAAYACFVDAGGTVVHNFSLANRRARLAAIAFFTWHGTTALAQGSSDMLELSLEDLADVSIASTIALGMHHTHPRGELMLGYSFMPMSMNGLGDGTQSVSDAELFSRGYMVAPTRMDMQMHMFELMYGVTDKMSIMAMLPLQRQSMDHVTAGGAQFTTQTDGIGDLSVSALYMFYRGHPHRLHLTTGVSLPTGSIDERGETPMGPDMKLPYSMQNGSGTVDPLVGLTYLGSTGPWSWGAHSLLRFRLGDNDAGYRLGNRYQGDTWLSRKLDERWSVYARMDAVVTTDVRGSDPELNPMMSPTADGSLRAGTRASLRLGGSVVLSQGGRGGTRFGLELGLPAYENLDGPQLKNDWTLNLSVQWVR